MYMGLFFLALTALVLFVLFIPELFPRCSCCLKLKFRPFIRIHKAVSLSPGYRGSRSVCTKCCRKYNIASLQDLEQIKTIKKRLEHQSFL